MGENSEREQAHYDPLDDSWREYRKLVLKELEYLIKAKDALEIDFDEMKNKFEKMQLSVGSLETMRNVMIGILSVLVPVILGGVAKMAFGW